MIEIYLNYIIKSLVIILENIENITHNFCHLRYKIPKEIPIIFHNGSTYDYHFVIKELAKLFDDLRENTD